MIILRKNAGIFSAQVNTEAQITEEYVVANVVQAINLEESTVELGGSGSSSFSSPSPSFNSVPKNEYCLETTDDALEYIAVYLAKKKSKTPFQF